MLVAGVNQTALGWPLKKNLGVHRPYFNPSYFADLSSKEAKKKHENLTEITKQYLRDMHVPEELIELTYRVSPEEIYVLNEQDLQSWVADYHPFMEDWLEAKCRHIERALPKEKKA